MIRKLVFCIMAILVVSGCSAPAGECPECPDCPEAEIVYQDKTVEVVKTAEVESLSTQLAEYEKILDELDPKATKVPTVVVLPKLEDFSIELVVIEKQCFGSAGCNVQVKPELYTDNPERIDQTYTIIYEIYGDEDGVMVNSMAFDSSQYFSATEWYTTAGVDTVLTAEPTRILVGDVK